MGLWAGLLLHEKRNFYLGVYEYELGFLFGTYTRIPKTKGRGLRYLRPSPLPRVSLLDRGMTVETLQTLQDLYTLNLT